MSKYIGPKLKLSRRENFDLSLKSNYINISDKCKFNKLPGNSIKKNKLSYYGIQLREKQKIKRIYGVLEKQFLNYYKKSIKKKCNTGEYLLQLLELRLDNIIYRSGVSETRRSSRQLINHKFILVNNTVVNIPSYTINIRDKITFSKKFINSKYLFNILLSNKDKEIFNWINFNKKEMYINIINIPKRNELPKDINEKLVIELYSK